MEKQFFLWKKFWMKNDFLFYPVIYTGKIVLEKLYFLKNNENFYKFCVNNYK